MGFQYIVPKKKVNVVLGCIHQAPYHQILEYDANNLSSCGFRMHNMLLLCCVQLRASYYQKDIDRS